MSFILILITLMFLADVLWWTWAHRMLGSVNRSRRGRIVLGVFMAIQLGSLLLLLGGRMIGERVDATFPRVPLIGVFLWHFILLPASVIWMAGWGLVAGARRLISHRSSDPEPDGPPSAGISRRDLLRTATVLAPPVATTLLTGASLSQLSDFRIRSFDLKFPNLPAELDGVRIAQVSDIHTGQFTTERILKKIVESTNELRSDLVLLTGDLINFSMSDLPGALDAVKRMDPRSGLYMIQGNHDLMQGREDFDNQVRRSGVPLLINESTVVNVRGVPVQLLGLQWGPGRGDAGIAQSMDVILPQLRPDAFPILMAHHPHAFDWATKATIPLTLSGHTHGGQIMPFGVGFGPLMYRYWTGLYEKGASKLVVSNGVGNWFPLRINAPAEIVSITLHRG